MEESICSRRRGGDPRNLQTNKSGPPPCPLERTDSPLRRALRQDKMSMSLQVTLGMRRELLSQELLGLFASLHLLWKTEERARVGEGRRGKSKVGKKRKLRFPSSQQEGT